MRRSARFEPAWICSLVCFAAACETNYYTTHIHPGADPVDAATQDASTRDAAVAEPGADTEPSPPPVSDASVPDAATPPVDSGTSEDDAGEDSVDSGTRPLADGAPLVNISPEEQGLDVFGTSRNHYWFIASEDQVERMNERFGGGGPIFLPGIPNYGDMYTPGGAGDAPTFVEHLLVTDPSGKTADYGKLEVRLVGESTGRPWTEHTLPNFKLDADEFAEKNRVGGVEHLRLNNAVVGSIFREKFAFDYYRELGYPAPRATFGRVSGTVWGAGVSVPYVVVEVYKKPFCKQWKDHFGGGCRNMWELVGDFGYGGFEEPSNCQFSQCENERVGELEQLVMSTPEGPGYKEALGEWLDWDAFHQFQCLSWIFATGDDALHNMNNFVLVEREDGKFQYLPYSVDISFGQDWYQEVPLAGSNSIARGCQSDEQCWADTIVTCEAMLEAFVDADPVGRLEQLHDQLEEDDMLRTGDERRYEELKAYLERRLEELPQELELNREAPHGIECEYPWVLCGDYCALPEECYLCEPGDVLPPPALPVPRFRPALNLVLAEPPVDDFTFSPDGGASDAATDAALPDAEDALPPPQTCLPFLELYSPN